MQEHRNEVVLMGIQVPPLEHWLGRHIPDVVRMWLDVREGEAKNDGAAKI